VAVVEAPRLVRGEKVAALLAQMRLADVDAADPAVVALVLEFTRRYNLAPIDPAKHLAKRWKAMYHGERVVAVFGEMERDDGRTLEVTDAYRVPDRLGRVAAFAVGLGYLRAVDSGQYDRLSFNVLFENDRMWRAFMRETKRVPHSVRFEYVREAA